MANDKIPWGIVVHIQERGWVDENRMKLWLEKVLAKCPCGLPRKPTLLVCNQYKSWRLNTQLAVIPGGLTSQIQPLDISINKPFKAFMH
jgi:hypothetical protein